jgi:hypothetical protein
MAVAAEHGRYRDMVVEPVPSEVARSCVAVLASACGVEQAVQAGTSLCLSSLGFNASSVSQSRSLDTGSKRLPLR